MMLCHLLPGLGYGMLVITSLVVIYYNLIIAWTLFYTFASFTSKLPWSDCQNYWNSNSKYKKNAVPQPYPFLPTRLSDCITVNERNLCREQNMTFWNQKCVNISNYCNSLTTFTEYNSSHCLNLTAQAIVNQTNIYTKLEHASLRVSSSEDYYR